MEDRATSNIVNGHKRCKQKSLFGIGNILALFVNTLTADEKYTLLSGFNLTQPIQIQLPKKQKVVCQIFSGFLKSISNFEQS